MKNFSVIFISFFLFACEMSLGEPDFIEFGGSRFTYDEKTKIIKDSVLNYGMENLKKHILSEVQGLKKEEFTNFDIIIVEPSNSTRDILYVRCHVETTPPNKYKQELINSCKAKLLSILQEGESANKRT